MYDSLKFLWNRVADKLHCPILPARMHYGSDDSGFVLTGESTIGLIVEAIRQKQSIILSGPRGCGKSYCVAAAIKEARRQGLILPGADIFLQGNREFPRDYLMEDAFVLRYDGTAVVPEMRSAPLFKFARRDEKNRPIVSGPENHVTMVELRDNEQKPRPVDRFVLFLDEINRFSDGILDSLLSVLEERKAILAGDTYRLPVVVLMTMNPPGYDGTARRLSPPLQARIGRNWRLYSPDLRTQTEILIPERRKQILTTHLEGLLKEPLGKLREEVAKVSKESAKQREAVAQVLSEYNQHLMGLLNQSKAQEHWNAELSAAGEKVDKKDPESVRDHRKRIEDALIASWIAEEKDGISPVICRKAALVCLCLWGLPREDESAHVYLTEETRSMLTELASDSTLLKGAMEEILELCSYGPDGRAATDWIQSSYSLACREKEKEEAKMGAPQVAATSSKAADALRVQERHFRATVIDTLSHKLNDTFSAANEPEKERRKHRAIRTIFDQIFSGAASRQSSGKRNAKLERYLNPLLEDETWLGLHKDVLWNNDPAKEHSRRLVLRGMFKEAGLLRRVEHERWIGNSPPQLGGFVGAVRVDTADDALIRHGVNSGILVQDVEEPTAFSSVAWRDFFARVSAESKLFDSSLTERMREMMEGKEGKPPLIEGVRPPIEAELLEYYPVLRQFGVKDHYDLLVSKSGGEEKVGWRKAKGRREREMLLAKAFTMIWERATGSTAEGWHLSICGDLGLNADQTSSEFDSILHELKLLLEDQVELAQKIDSRSLRFRMSPAHWLGKPFRPDEAQFIPGDLASNIYRRELIDLLEKIDAKLNSKAEVPSSKEEKGG